jgi:hypothetical protein
MDEHDWPLMEAFIDSLSEDECRRILAVMTYEHKCSGSRIGCCGTFRCQPCHVDHLRSAHGEHSAQFWNKLCQSTNLTWADPRPPTSKPKSSPRRRKEVNDPTRQLEVPSELSQLEAAIQQMKKALREQGYQL